MRVNFYEYSEQVKPVARFGIVDPDDRGGKFPAQICYDENVKDTWGAWVSCNNRSDYSFIAVDNNIPLTRTGANGAKETASRCDAMLYTGKTVCFIELKDERESFLQRAIAQISATLQAFGNEIERFEYKKAYVCNKGHPQFHSSFSQAQSEFYKKHKVVLRVRVDIEELK